MSKEFDPKAAKAARDEELKGIMDSLEQGVKDVFSSEKYKTFLDTMAKFPRYSVNNNILIMMQRPDASLVQSYGGWKKMGRNVKRGEKGIRILAPAPYKAQVEQQKVDSNGRGIFDTKGNPVMETVEVDRVAFKPVSTFDVSQTEGKELPSLGVSELTGSVENYNAFIEAIKEVCPVPIGFEDIKSGAKGYYHTTDKRIAIQSGMSELQTLKTAIHEMTHQMLHSGEDKKTRSSKEVEAESVAYTVCKHYGLDTSDYSFSYVAGWSSGKDVKELKESLDTIQKAAKDIITSLDEKLSVHQKDKEVAKEQVTFKEQSAPKEDIAQSENKIIADAKPLGYIKVKPERTSILDKLRGEKTKIKLKAAKEMDKKEVAINGR